MASRRARLARGLVVETLEPAPATSAARATVVSMVTSGRDYLACARQCLLELEQDKLLFCSPQVATELRQAPRLAAFGVAIVVVADSIELSRLAFDFRSREQVVRWLDQAPGFPLETSQRAAYMAKSYAVSSTVAFARSAFRCQVHVWADIGHWRIDGHSADRTLRNLVTQLHALAGDNEPNVRKNLFMLQQFGSQGISTATFWGGTARGVMNFDAWFRREVFGAAACCRGTDFEVQEHILNSHGDQIWLVWAEDSKLAADKYLARAFFGALRIKLRVRRADASHGGAQSLPALKGDVVRKTRNETSSAKTRRSTGMSTRPKGFVIARVNV